MEDVPGYAVLTEKVKVGARAEDAVEACNAIKAWRMADAVDGLALQIDLCDIDAIVSRCGVPLVAQLECSALAPVVRRRPRGLLGQRFMVLFVSGRW